MTDFVEGSKFKTLEHSFEHKLNPSLNTIIRFDLKSFHTLKTKVYPIWDFKLHYLLTKTVFDICNTELRGMWKIIYHQSDEITVVLDNFKYINPERDQSVFVDFPFSGRTNKLLTAVLSSRFWIFLYKNMKEMERTAFDVENKAYELMHNIVSKNTKKEIKNSNWIFENIAFFKGCDINICQTDLEGVKENLAWRRQDAIRNSKSGLAQYFFSHKQLHGKSNNEQIEMVEKEYGIKWMELPSFIKRGLIICESNKWFETSGFYESDEFTKEIEDLICNIVFESRLGK